MKTTDPQDELFDIVDENDYVIGTAKRGEVHKNKKLIHRAVNILVFKRAELLIQKRSNTKDTYPNYWTSSCSGHVLSNDTYENTAFRELQEELGVMSNNLTFLTKTIIYYPQETEYMSYYRVDLPKNQKIKINTKEISEYKFIQLDKLILNRKIKQSKFTPDFEHIIDHYLKSNNHN